ncbi:MAG TPA: hypothetical protein EYQ42_09750 [Thiotrichaceae bacterium]|jgi:hypothetical protein|nr:hypothetical protein [Thiotrichaceae bacterium]HIM09175.1 hypothetical protein [Gammaproteobacteria bacterium]
MNLIKSSFIVFVLIFSQAHAEESWYQVEAIVFDRTYPDLDGEQWQNQEFKIRNNMVELQLSDNVYNSELDLAPFMILDKEQNRMNGVYRRLKLSNEYRPLYHVSWQQEASERRESRHVHILKLDGERVIAFTAITDSELPEEEPEFLDELITTPELNKIIDGSIRIRSGFYLHADIELSYFTQIPPENKILRSSEESFSGFQEKTVVKLKETRKIKLNEIHYFDHPMYGVILQVSRLN